MKQDQFGIKQYVGGYCCYYYFMFVKVFYVVVGEDYCWYFQFGGSVYQDFGQVVGKFEIVVDLQWYINDVYGVVGLYQGGGDKQYMYVFVLLVVGLCQCCCFF